MLRFSGPDGNLHWHHQRQPVSFQHLCKRNNNFLNTSPNLSKRTTPEPYRKCKLPKELPAYLEAGCNMKEPGSTSWYPAEQCCFSWWFLASIIEAFSSSRLRWVCRHRLKASDISCSNLVMLVHVVHCSTPLYMSTMQFVTVAILAQGTLLAGAAEEAFLTFFWHESTSLIYLPLSHQIRVCP